MGSEYINPHSLSKTSNWGQSTLLLQTSEHSHSLTPSAAKSVKCTLTPFLVCLCCKHILTGRDLVITSPSYNLFTKSYINNLSVNKSVKM